jgi:spore coat protein U-like protein
MKKTSILSFLALLPLFAFAPRADAQSCTFSSISGVSFGSYDVLRALPTTATGTISISCKGTGGSKLLVINLSTGSGTFTNRTLRTGGSVLNYNLYPDAVNSKPWGDGTGGTYQYSADPANISNTSLTVYGTILPGQDVGAGSYTDTITVTMSF